MIHLFAALMVVSGTLPLELGVPTSVSWINRDASAQIGCEVLSTSKWRCELPDSAHGSPDGIVLMTGDLGVAWRAISAGAVEGSVPRVRHWGRLVALIPAPQAGDLRGLAITAWKPDRSIVRQMTDRFYRIEDSTIDVLRLSDTAAWVAGDATDGARFISIDGLDVGSYVVPVTELAKGPPDSPFLVPLSTPLTLTGRVQDGAWQDVAGAEVELFAPLGTSGALVFRDQTRSDDYGAFGFDRLTPGSFVIVVTHPVAGRGMLRLRSLAEPAVVRLTAPLLATGRVLRRGQPAPSARVRFVPESGAFAAASDPHDLISDEVVTGDDGRFTVALPPRPAGTLQVIGADLTTVRVPVPTPAPIQGRASAVGLGDITLPDDRHLTVRLLDGGSCSMSAAGPLGALGLTVARATGGGGVSWFDIPEPGEWALGAECGGVSYALQPGVVSVSEQGPEAVVDAQLIR